MKTKLSHVRVNVKNLDTALKWYTTVLGFKVAGTWPPEKPNYAHFLKLTYSLLWRMKIFHHTEGLILMFQMLNHFGKK
ncbi:VOC family protein [Niallia alba]|uniref:VOC family protein n=1 Tax=Niallia alba TaxID=2729105 RepID=A0A7Y0PP81_9BACI|nr:VOC family protein [Niallia alba]NMO79878.1 VOC family protein [Niallia alba]